MQQMARKPFMDPPWGKRGCRVKGREKAFFHSKTSTAAAMVNHY
jgi:hypothetical protein